MVRKIRACVLISGGLDSLITVKIMQEQGIAVFGLFFKLPFSVDFEKEVKSFCKKQEVPLKVIDCTKGKFLKEYLEMLKKAEHGRGKGFNPCIDCRIFLFKKSKEIIEKKNLNFLVTGEVLDERPMSQKKKLMNLIEVKSELGGLVLRPLSAKLLEESIPERKGLVNRDAFLDIHGKRRIRQIEIARKFNIFYPNPAGGCLLCEKEFKRRFRLFFTNRKMWKYFYLLSIGRHFFIENNWIVLGRNENENKILEKVKGAFLVTPNYIGPTALVFEKINLSSKKMVDEMIKTYSKKGSLKERKFFEKYKI